MLVYQRVVGHIRGPRVCCDFACDFSSFSVSAHPTWGYPLVMTNITGWNITMLLIGKPSISMGHLYHGELLVITRGTLFGLLFIPNDGGLYEDVPQPTGSTKSEVVSSGNWKYEVNLEVTFWLHTVQHPKLEVTNHFPMFFPMVPWNSGWIGLRRSTCRTLPMK